MNLDGKSVIGKLLTDIIDLKSDNIMVRLEDKSILERDARKEFETPLPQKKIQGSNNISFSK